MVQAGWNVDITAKAGGANRPTTRTNYGGVKMIALLLPFLPIILAVVAALGGMGANLWLEFTDWQTAAIFSCALVACVYVAQTDKPWARLAIVAIVGAALYLKGGVDKEAALAAKHEADIHAIHNGYAEKAAAEQERQRRANEVAAAEAEVERQRQDAELAELQARLVAADAGASSDKLADQPSLSLDAVRRLNAVRVRGQSPGS